MMSHQTVTDLSTTTPRSQKTVRKKARYWDKISNKYARSPIADEPSYQKKLKMTQDYLQADFDVFEFGCGTGSTALAHAPLVKHIHAVDISSKMLDIATDKAAAAGISNITFEQNNIDTIDLPDNSVDVVIGLSILHLVDDLNVVIDKVRTMLKPGGYFITSTPCLADTHWYLKPVLPIGTYLGFLPKVVFFTKTALDDSLVNAGFSIEINWQPSPGKAV